MEGGLTHLRLVRVLTQGTITKKIQCRLNRFIHIWTCFYSPLHRNIIWSVKAVSVLRIFVSLLLLLLLYTFLWNSRMTELRVHVRLWTLNNII